MLRAFVKCLRHTRTGVRSLVHTLDLAYQDTGLDEPLQSSWLASALQLLPNLQSIVVDKHPWFDHRACLYLRGEGDAASSSSVRLLDVRRLHNIIPSTLPALLAGLPGLVYLSFAHTKIGGSHELAPSVRSLRDLRVLKLCDTGLTDARLRELAAAVGTRLRGLDVSCNALTDRGVDALFEYGCVATASCGTHDLHRSTSIRFSPRKSSERASRRHNGYLDAALYLALTSDIVGRFEDEDEHSNAIAHLDVSSTNISRNGIARLLGLPYVQKLDAGNVRCGVDADDASFTSSFRTLMQSPNQLTYLRLPADILLGLKHISVAYAQTALPTTAMAESPCPALKSTPPQSPAMTNLPARSVSWPAVLVVSDIPSHTPTRAIIEAISDLLRSFAKADRLAQLDYTLPPGKKSASPELLMLEISASNLQTLVQRPSQSGTFTQDEDASTLWTAGKGDFSFFDDGCGGWSSSTTRAPTTGTAQSVKPTFDVVAEIVAFRRKAKAMFLAGEAVTDHWTGRIEVRRAYE